MLRRRGGGWTGVWSLRTVDVPARQAGASPTAAPPGAMRKDWDRRAREDHKLHIAAGHAGSEEQFLESGERDLGDLVLDGIRLRPEASALEIG